MGDLILHDTSLRYHPSWGPAKSRFIPLYLPNHYTNSPFHFFLFNPSRLFTGFEFAFGGFLNVS